MDQLANLLQGFAGALTPINLLLLFCGAFLGTAVGVMPGLGSAMAVALLLLPRPGRRPDYVRRCLLRRPVR